MSENTDYNSKITLEGCRAELDSIDAALLELFQKRLDIAGEIGEYKRIHGLPVTDEKREAAKLASLEENTPAEALPAARRLMRFLMDEAKAVQRRGLNVYLIGMPDCGKTRVGKRLSKLMELPLADTDKLIMRRMDMSIDAIFASMGEESFRSMETMTLVQLVKKGGFIVATGGGLPLWGFNAELMRSSGVTVFLDRRLELLLGQNTVNRPLLRQDGDPDASIRRLYAERRPKYLAAADIVLDPDAPNAAETAACMARERLDSI